MPSPVNILHAPDQSRFETQVEGHLAVLEYSLEGDVMTIHHTFVPVELRGTGLAAALAKAAFDHAREAGLKVIPACSYIAGYAKRFPEAGDLVR